MAYFRVGNTASGGGSGATITVTYSSDFYGETLTATNGNKTVTVVAPSTGTVDINVPEGGTWVISATIGGVPYSASVDVELAYSATITPKGSTITPTDDVQTWLECAGIINLSYTTVAEVLSDSTTLLALMSDNNAVDYLVRSTTFATDICADSTAMTYIGANDYCADTLLANNTWLTAICNSTYFESVLSVKVPTMTSNTTPSGTCIRSSAISSSTEAFNAFDTNTSTWWNANGGVGQWIGYTFTSSVKVNTVYLYNAAGLHRVGTIKVQGSNDGFSSDINDVSPEFTPDSLPYTYSFTNSNSYTSYRVINISGVSYFTMYSLQFYSRA